MDSHDEHSPSDRRGVRLGAWSMIDSPAAAVALAGSGADWLVLDNQHGLWHDRGTIDALALLGATAPATCALWVRVTHASDAAIGRALDAGATGVVVPMVNDAETADSVARAAHYPPLGRRSWGSMAAYRGAEVPSTTEANDLVQVAVMIETPEAVGRAAEIATTDGVDMLFVGPFDLSIALGVTLETLLDDESDTSALDAVVRACRSAGIEAGAFAGSPEIAARLAARGFTSLAVAVDSALLARAATGAITEARGLVS